MMHQALYTMEYKDMTRSQDNACQRITFRLSMQIPADRMIASATAGLQVSSGSFLHIGEQCPAGSKSRIRANFGDSKGDNRNVGLED
jgi:hypothetical protein